MKLFFFFSLPTRPNCSTECSTECSGEGWVIPVTGLPGLNDAILPSKIDNMLLISTDKIWNLRPQSGSESLAAETWQPPDQ